MTPGRASGPGRVGRSLNAHSANPKVNVSDNVVGRPDAKLRATSPPSRYFLCHLKSRNGPPDNHNHQLQSSRDLAAFMT
jgi:hypothetical protein